MIDEYTTIRIRIHPKNEALGTYPVEAMLDDGNFFSGGELRIQQEQLLVSQLEPQAYGLLLFNALFAGPIRDAYSTVAARAEATTGGRVRVRLWIDDRAAELHALPWERLYHIHKGQLVPLSTSTLTPFSRYTPMRNGEPQAINTPPVQLLYAIANPSDLESQPKLKPIDVEQEVENLRQALGDLRANSQLQVTLLPGRTGLSPGLRARLEQDGYRIRDGVTSLEELVQVLPGCHVFHFLGHGFFERKGEHGGGTAALYLEKADGTWEPVKDDELVTKLVSVDPVPHLAFLAACQSAKRDAETEHPFVGLGPKLLQAGVPAVIAMQDVVPMELARQLTADFYRHLLLHGQVDLALNQTRLLLFETDEVDWAIPVLFSRLVDNELVSFPSDPSLQRTDDLMAATAKVLAATRSQEQGREMIAELEGLLEEWQESHRNLVDLESALRRTGEDPKSFAERFTGFYHDFKDYYNAETWADEDSLIRAAMRLRDEVLPKMKPQMNDEAFKQVQRALDQHVGTRGVLVAGFGEFLDSMDEAVMEIRRLLDSGDVEGAIHRKRDFELQIAPSLRNSRKLLRQMSSQITAVDDLMNRLETQESEDQVVASGELIDTIVMQRDRQQTLDHISQRLVTTHGVDEQVLQKPGVSAVAPHIRNQIDQMIAAQRGMAARGIPATPQTLYRMGMLAAYRRDYDVAIDYFRQATQADPEYAEAFQATSWLQQSRAMHDLQAGDYDAALEKLAEARAAAGQIRPQDQALVMQGYVAKTQAQIAERTQNQTDRDKYLREAAQFFQSAVQLNPDNVGVHNGLGNVEYMLGNLDAAIAATEQAIQLNPNYTAAHHDLGTVFVAKMKAAQRAGDQTRSEEWCRKALQAFERCYQLSERDPGFSNDDRVRIRGYISWLQGQCGPSHT